jgi:membrane associated rhomboid family serine protease
MTELPRGQEAEALLAEARKALWVMVGFLMVIWLVQIINSATGYELSYDYGIHAREPGSLPEIFSAPFLHFGWSHIEGNSGPLFIFGFLAAYRGVKRFLGVTALVVVGSGLGAWFTAGADTVGAGASGVVFGYFGYIIVRGLFDRRPIDIVLGLVMALCFAYQFSLLIPAGEGIGWQAHLFGFITGVLGGWIFRDRRTETPAVAATTQVPTTRIPTTQGSGTQVHTTPLDKPAKGD